MVAEPLRRERGRTASAKLSRAESDYAQIILPVTASPTQLAGHTHALSKPSSVRFNRSKECIHDVFCLSLHGRNGGGEFREVIDNHKEIAIVAASVAMRHHHLVCPYGLPRIETTPRRSVTVPYVSQAASVIAGTHRNLRRIARRPGAYAATRTAAVERRTSCQITDKQSSAWLSGYPTLRGGRIHTDLTICAAMMQ